MEKLRIVYFGSSDFSADFLEKILTDTSIKHLIEVKFVVTQPDRPVGRKQIIIPTPVKSIALKHNLEVLEIKDLKIENSLKISNLKLKIQQLDLGILYAYAGIIPQDFLSMPKLGFWCLHPSLLPKYRGTSPMAAALINGDKKTGMTIIKMDDQIDHGPIIAQESLTIEKDDRRPDLEKKLTDLGFEIFKKILAGGAKKGFPTARTQGALAGMNSRQAPPKLREQNHEQATYTKKLKKEDGFIPFKNWKLKIENSPEEVFNLFRGLFPWPGIWTLIRPTRSKAAEQKRLKITDMELVNGKLIIKKVQLEGKKEVDFETFNRGYKIF